MIELYNTKFFIIIAVFFILYFLLEKLDIKIVVILLAILYFFKEYFKDFEKKTKGVVENKNDEKKFYKKYNTDIEDTLKKIKKYKKISPINYKQGIYYWKLFMKQIKQLEHSELFHYDQYFDNAEMYLKKSVNAFQGLIVSREEPTLIDGLKHHDFDYSKDLSNLIKELYRQGYLLLYNFSLTYNEKWKENPNRYNSQIILDYPQSYDKDISNNDYF
tara:strand:- start:388 stop:1038 length:651 start_codon:yes stop_codon:yes gene_type:complete